MYPTYSRVESESLVAWNSKEPKSVYSFLYNKDLG